MAATKKITAEVVQETDSFQELNPMLKKITLNKRNLIAIENGYNVACNIGFDKWDQQTQARYVNRMIVQELLEEE